MSLIEWDQNYKKEETDREGTSSGEVYGVGCPEKKFEKEMSRVLHSH